MMAQARANMWNRRVRGGRGRRGFSLTELMISIGVLAVGLTMSASLFPAALQANRDSVRSVLGSIICQNGLAVTKARWSALTDQEFANSPGLQAFRDASALYDEELEVLADDGVGRPNFLTAADRTYPFDDPDSPYGFVVMMRPMDEDADVETFEGYQIVVTSYRRNLSNGQVICYRVTGSVNVDDKVFTSWRGNDGLVRAGTPVIDSKSGRFATVRNAIWPSGSQGALDHSFEPEEATGFLLVVEKDPNATPPPGEPEALRFSPALSTMVTRTGLTGERVNPQTQ